MISKRKITNCHIRGVRPILKALVRNQVSRLSEEKQTDLNEIRPIAAAIADFQRKLLGARAANASALAKPRLASPRRAQQPSLPPEPPQRETMYPYGGPFLQLTTQEHQSQRRHRSLLITGRRFPRPHSSINRERRRCTTSLPTSRSFATSSHSFLQFLAHRRRQRSPRRVRPH